MKKIINFVLIMSLILMAFPVTALGKEKTSVSQYLDKTLSDMVNKKQVKGAIVSVVNSNVKELCKGYGFADEEKGIAAHEDNTAFRIGSVSKTFVGVAALQLAHSGKLGMQTPISVYLEADFPNFKHEITMHDLLTHTAGFEDMFSGVWMRGLSKAEPLASSIRKYMPAQVFIPGEVVSYSNYGIALAAYVVQCITGQDFYKYSDDNIFKPLGMTKTSFKLDFKGVKTSKAYLEDGNETSEPLSNLYPEGSGVSTAADMSKYIQWLMDDSNRALGADLKQQLFEKHFTMSDEFQGVGYTWNRKARNSVVYYDKKGETINFSSRIAIYPKQKTGVFISVNTKVNEKKLDEIMDQVTYLILGQEKEQSLYTGEQTADISGYYITTRSNFTRTEKIIYIPTPNRVFHITGSLSKGFFIKGKKLLPIGENYYSTPMGNLKYVERNGSVYLANSTAISFVRTNWYESNGVQMLVLASFTVFSLIMAIVGIISLLSRKTGRENYFLGSLSIIQIALFIGMCILIFSGISNFNMINIETFITIFGILITITSVCGVFYTIYLFAKKIFAAKNILLIAWNISSILFCLWMLQINVL